MANRADEPRAQDAPTEAPGKGATRDATGLNPKLRSRTETSHHTERSSAAPHETASVQRDEGRAWPMIWLVVTIVCVAIALYFLLW